ncbi:MAG TPA: TerC family protein [Xanthobacteraceae bacterium]|nr:TerC family protein [Xanthobacteraceae bacterium]
MGGIDLSADFSSPQFWWDVFSIFVVNGLLSGDNAVLIALACRSLPRRERIWGMVIGAGFASVLLILFTAVASSLMQRPYLRFVSGLILVWIAMRLAGPADHDREGTPEAAKDLWRAVRLVVVADIVMSLDNVVAVAAIANGQYILLGLGLVISIPIVIGGSALVLSLMERFPIIVWIGAAILGWVAGGLLATDPMVQRHLGAMAHVDVGIDTRLFGATGHHHIGFGFDLFQIALGVIGAIVVVLGGLIWRAANGSAQEGETRKEHQQVE